MRRHLILTCAALLALTALACSDDDDDETAESATTISTAAASQATTTTASSPAGAQIVLAPDGLGVVEFGAATAGPGIEEAHDLHTPEGLGTGDYVSDLRKAYPAAEISEGADIAGHFSVRNAPGQARHLWGYLTGTGDTDLVDTIFGGDCGPDPTL